MTLETSEEFGKINMHDRTSKHIKFEIFIRLYIYNTKQYLVTPHIKSVYRRLSSKLRNWRRLIVVISVILHEEVC